jgi:alpha-L-fucosidase
MLNLPLPNSGALDADELAVLEGITKWMAVNSEGIHGTRPWTTSGNAAAPPAGQQRGFNERNRKDLTASDVRFTMKNGALYAFVMGWPEREAAIPLLARGGENRVGKIQSVEMLGHRGKLKFTQDEKSLRVQMPPEKPSDYAIALRIVGA